MLGANKPARRMTLRELLTHSEKCSRDLGEHVHSTLMPRIADTRELSRPIRRRSHFPTVVALVNALNKLDEAHSEIQATVNFLLEQMEAIRDHARRERVSRH